MTRKQLVSRLLQIIVVLIGISFLTFLLTYLSPGDPVRTMLSATGVMPSEELVQSIREEMGLNDPFFTQYFRWLGNCLHGDFGDSYSFSRPVVELLAARLWPTLKLTIFSMVLMLIISVPLGMCSAVYKDSWIDNLVRGFTFLGISLPNFWVGLLLMLVFCVQVNWLPVICSGGDFKSMILPSVTLAIAMSSKYTRQVRATVLEELNKDYVQGARARGIRGNKILIFSVLKASMLTIVTLLALSIGSLLGGTAIVESIFMWDGVGKMAVDAITMRDYPIIQAYVIWMAVIYVVVNLITDLIYHYLDPRIRLGQEEA